MYYYLKEFINAVDNLLVMDSISSNMNIIDNLLAVYYDNNQHSEAVCKENKSLNKAHSWL